MELDTLASPANARMDSPTGWTNRQAVTVEARIKVLPDSEDGGFNLVAADQLGSTSLVLSPDKAELMHSHMAVGRAAFAMDTTDDFHVYRFTRDAIGLYWHLYIDDNPVAAVADQHAYGMLLSYSRFWFGDIAFPVPDNGCHVLIDYIRWYEAFTGPVRYPDLDVDGDVDLLDFAEFQVCSGGSGSGECTATDFDGDDDVDLTDFTTLEACLSGPDVTPPAGCTQ